MERVGVYWYVDVSRPDAGEVESREVGELPELQSQSEEEMVLVSFGSGGG